MGTESYSFELAERSDSRELERGRYYLEKRPKRDDTEVDQKLERLKEQLLMKLGGKDNSSPMLPTSLPFVKWIQQETIPMKFMMSTGQHMTRQEILEITCETTDPL